MKKKHGFNHFFQCPNCRAVYEMLPIREISKLCKRCLFKRPIKEMCKRGINQYTKRVVCRWYKYNAGGKRRKRRG